ncbi:sugar ABC transporter permease [Bifidobacterium sp. ESL0775]|uniref:carbohydrate ABC transporter permease n=1 Tax=Bifidobacterium sp. ESL0775 TaxID=2983230 RepID=UPI0023F694CF|nr:sugar ABC transporter permease [Bifidobacterium sp. ESL0775]WEV69384.1 sugar ABC transporter permease [Bifidobacterium sp. ESL0775]
MVTQTAASPASPARQGFAHRFKGGSINLFYLPAIILLVVFIVYPLISGIGLSFTNWDGFNPQKDFVGAANYKMMLQDKNFWPILRNTLVYGFGSTIIQQVLGLGVALLLNTKIHGRNLMRAIVYLPALVSPVIMGTMYYFIFQYQQGALNTIIAAFGGKRLLYFQNAGLAVAIIVIINSVQFFGVSMIIYLAGLQGMDHSVVEAAELDGAHGWNMFFHITLPQLKPAFMTSVVLNLIGGLKLYDIITVLTGGGPGYATNSMSTYISTTYFRDQNAGYASALGVVLFVFIAVITYLLNSGMDKLGRQE